MNVGNMREGVVHVSTVRNAMKFTISEDYLP